MIDRKLVFVGGLLAGCVAEDEAFDEPFAEEETEVEAISANQKRAHADAIKAAAAARGITNPVIIAGIAHAESAGLAQCWSELTWACQGPWSNDCGGPVMAGAGDGACSLQQGGIGMFQLDAGTHAQTLAQYGADVVNLHGNARAGVGVVIHKLNVCPNTKFGDDGVSIDLINAAVPGTQAYETFMTAMAWCYNGCAPSYQSCSHDKVRNAYKSGVQAMLDAFGEEYWRSGASVRFTSSAKRVAANPDGRMEVFARGDDDAVWHRWQLAPNGDWSGWADLGGRIVDDPVVARNADGRLEVFAVFDDGTVRHRWQLGGAQWGEGWADLGGVGIVGTPGVMANADGRLELFVRSWDGQLWHKWQREPSSAFVDDWYHLGTNIPTDPVIASNADGRLELFVRGEDNAVWHRWQLEPNGQWGGWSSLGGEIVGEPTIATHRDGRLEVFAIGTDGGAWHRWQMPEGGWSSGWANLGGVGLEGTPAAASNADGRIELVVRSWDGQLWHKWQTASNAPFTEDWFHFGEHTTSDPQLGRNADGRLEAFVRGGDGALWHRWQTEPNGKWDVWVSGGGGLASF